jgi:hypothetical protein
VFYLPSLKNPKERESCIQQHDVLAMVEYHFSLFKSNPLGPRKGSATDHGNQNRIVSPPKMISPVGACIKYLPNPVGP